MKRLYLLFICLFFCVCGELHAQGLVYKIIVRNQEGSPLSGVKVSSFHVKRDGKDAFKEAQDNFGQFDAKKFSVMAESETTANGSCNIRCMSSGAIILDGYQCQSGVYELKLYFVEDCKENDDDYTLELILPGQPFKKQPKTKVIQLKDGQSTEFTSFGTTALAQLNAEGYGKMPPGGVLTERNGKNTVTISREIDIDALHAKSTGRFVACPIIHFHEYKDSVVYMPPAVVDGEDYEKGMERRMGYDKSRDRLNDYSFDAGTRLRDHQAERILYREKAYIVKGTKYHVPGIIWYEDYNGVYYKDSLLFSDGKESEPMRFLNWDDARKLSSINRTVYACNPSYEPSRENEGFPLKFEQGDRVLNLRDSVTLAQRDKMMNWIKRFYSDQEGEISKIVVKGYSSPEGLESRNRQLSKDRAKTIQDLLKSNFDGVKVDTAFDQYNNIVPWEIVADTMTLMDDTIAHGYADEIRGIVEANKGFDAQYRVIRARPELYKYLDENVLDRVRRVYIEVYFVVQKILSKEEIVERFETDPEFLAKMNDYQYYVMLCHLADEEKWDDLLEVAKNAYYRESLKEHGVPRTVRLYPNHPIDSTTRTIPQDIPYPLAGYYYAVATMRKGKVDTSILKPYFDDGSVGAGGPRKHMNQYPFIVAQVLMYCQDEDFDLAKKLLEKYNLMSIPELEGLIMFVRCLKGEYRDDEKVRRYVMASSEMNKAVIYAALGKYKEALEILYSDNVEQPDAKVEYLKAICKFRSLNGNMTSLDKDAYSGSAVYNFEGEYGRESSAFAFPMLEAFKLDPKNVKYLENDGYFNNAYRQMMLYFWKRYERGIPVEKIAREYDALVKQMREQNGKHSSN